VKDLSVKCRHSAPSGTEIDSNQRTIYEVVPANSTKTVHDVNMGFIAPQVVSSRCRIEDFVIVKQ
jgi:hypothetical protein